MATLGTGGSRTLVRFAKELGCLPGELRVLAVERGIPFEKVGTAFVFTKANVNRLRAAHADHVARTRATLAGTNRPSSI